MIRLGVNIDHVATVRNARGEAYPDPVKAAALAELGGADNITCHLREDRRHIIDRDVKLLRETVNIPLNFEMALTDEMIDIALKTRPHAVTLVPEKREELTTEGGLNIETHKEKLIRTISKFKEEGILTSLFIDMDQKSIELSKEVGAEAVEIHTGDFCRNMEKALKTKDKIKLVEQLKVAAKSAHDHNMQVHFGHGLNYSNANWLQNIPFCEEANIGHAIIGRAIFVGLEKAVREMKELINNPKNNPIAW